MKKPVIRQSNDLIEASYKIASLGESRLIRLLISQIEPSDEEFKTYKINVVDFARVFGLNTRDGRNYELIDNASQALTKRSITVRDGKSYLHMNWLSSAKYTEGDGFVTLRFDPELKPYLLQLKGYFTQYKLDTIVNFRSVYSIKLYELLKSEEFKANAQGRFKRHFEYSELREKLGVEEKEYEFFKDFRIKAIEIAKKEINQYSDLFIMDVEYLKTGRKYTHMIFDVARKAQCDLDLQGGSPSLEESPHEKETSKEIKELVSMGITQETALQWLKTYGVRRINRNIEYAQEMVAGGKINNISGYIKTAIISDIAKGIAAKKKAAKEKSIKIDADNATKAEIEVQSNKKELNKREALMNDFHNLEENEQATIRTRYEKQLLPIPLKTWIRAKEKNKNKPETELTVKVSFLRYFETYKSNLRLPV